MRFRFSLKIPKLEKIMLFYYFTMSIWREHLFTHLPGGGILGPAILWLLIVLVLLKQSRYWGQYIDIFVFYLIILGLFFFKFWGNATMSVWITRTYGVLSVITWGGIYSYAVIRLQNNIQEILGVLKKTGIVLSVYYAWRALEVIRNGYWTYIQFGVVRHTTSNMSWGYGVLMALCFISIYLLKEKIRWVIIPILVGLFGILIYGSRGTMIGFLLGICFLILTYNNGRMKMRNYISLFLGIGIGIFLLSDAGLRIISDLLRNMGVSSRFIDSLVDFSFNNFEETSNGRWVIWTTVINMIKNGPFYGYGVFGERNTVYALGMKWGYSHNIFLELLVSFGWLIGSIIIIVLIIGMVRFFIKVKDKNEKLLFVIFLTLSFELLLSNTLWLHFAPWALMALYVNHFKGKYHVKAENSVLCS